MLQGWLASNIAAEDIYIIERKEVIENLKAKYPVNFLSDISEIQQLGSKLAICLAVKPQDVEAMLKSFPYSPDNLIISIVAGKTLAFFSKHIGDKVKVVRTMPNLPAVIGQGMTGMYASENVTDDERKFAEKLFAGIGSHIWVEREELIDAVTAISGSGPAYYYLFTEYLTEAAKELGLKEDIARELAYQTFIGSANLLKSTGENPDDLRNKVTTPGGTTEAAIKEFNKDDCLKDIITAAAKAAAKRSRELAD
jgi:pyrroline-5-carboxylate reductase